MDNRKEKKKRPPARKGRQVSHWISDALANRLDAYLGTPDVARPTLTRAFELAMDRYLRESGFPG